MSLTITLIVLAVGAAMGVPASVIVRYAFELSPFLAASFRAALASLSLNL